MRDAFGRDDFVHYVGFGLVITKLLLLTWRGTFFSLLTKGQKSFFHTASAPGNLLRLKIAITGIFTM
uniref:Uncharacterized protein n=1 Tax=Arundo donax TaxID=35708 RepID=A0A0A9AWW6_ARUDO